jgi:hypothetical protein
MKKVDMNVDEAHSIFWKMNDITLFALKLRDTHCFSIVEPERQASIILSGDQFSSLVCELLKYCLDLPEVARGVPCPITCLQVPHGCLRTMKSKIRKSGDDFKTTIEWDERLLKYHGCGPNEWHWEEGEVGIGLAPNSSLALQERIITEFRIVGIDKAVKIQTEENPALKLNLTIKKCMLDAIDNLIGLGIFLNRQDFMLSAIRRELTIAQEKI